MQQRAVLFDLDGTLLDTLEDLGDSMNEVLKGLGLPEHPIRAYQTFVGDGVQNLVRRALPAERREDGELVQRCVKRMREEYSRRWRAKTKPYDGIPDLLENLSSAGIRAAILSNKPHPAVLEIVAHFFPDTHFDAVLGARPGIPIKPDAGAALEISRQLAIPPGSFLYLGDTNTDMITARAAGMFPVGVLWGFRGEAELREAGAAVVVSRPGQVTELLQTG